MMAWLRRLSRVVRPGRGKHRGQPSRRVKPEALPVDEQWILDLLPPTPPPPPAEPAEAWAPRITRWVRVACPLPDDTVFLTPVCPAVVLELMARGFAWDPR